MERITLNDMNMLLYHLKSLSLCLSHPNYFQYFFQIPFSEEKMNLIQWIKKPNLGDVQQPR